MKTLVKRGLIVLASIVCILALVIAAMFIRQAMIDGRIDDDISFIYESDAYRAPVAVEGVGVMEQNVSCGYACIELLAQWQGMDVTESYLLAQNNGRITTAMGDGFVQEVNRQFPEFNTIKYANLPNSELLSMVYQSLERGMPVPFEFAALYADGERSAWTLHFALVTAMDVGADKITVSNPYGYTETYSLNEFLSATRYDSYEDMEVFFKLGFAAGIFNKNTIYVMDSAQVSLAEK